MDIDGVVAVLRSKLDQGTLRVTGTDLESPDIAHVLDAYLPDGLLVIMGVAEIIDGGTYAEAHGTGGPGGPFEGQAVVATFTTPGDVAQVVLATQAPPGWTWATSFPGTAGTLLALLTFVDVAFELRSQGQAEGAGLSFSGTLDLQAELAAVAWLLGQSSTIGLSGPVPIEQGVPLPDLASARGDTVDVGFLQLADVRLVAGATLVPATDTAPATPDGFVGLATDISFSVGGTDVVLPLSATFPLDPTTLLLTVDLAAIGTVIDAGLAELASLVGGYDFGPDLSGVPLSSILSLRKVLVQIDLAAQSIESVRIALGSTQPWTLVSERRTAAAAPTALLSIEDITIVLALFAPDCSQPGVAVFGTMILGGGQLDATALYPGYTFGIELAEDTAIDLTQVIEHFVGEDPGLPALSISELELEADPTNGAYEGRVVVDSDWTIPLGSTSLVVRQLGLALSREDGSTTARLDGAVTIAGADVVVGWDLPGAFQISGSIPSIDLTELISTFSPVPIGPDFPSLALGPTELYVERSADAMYSASATTVVPGFGAFQIGFREDGDVTGWVIGFVLEPGWSLERISPAFAPLSFITLRQAALRYSTIDDPSFAFTPFPDPVSPFPPILPGAPPGTAKGLDLYAELELTGGPLDVIAQILPGLSTLQLVASLPEEYVDTRFSAATTTPFTLIEGVLVFDRVSVEFAPGQESFALALDATVTIEDDDLGLRGRVAVSPGAASIQLATTTPWVNPFGIDRLTVEGMGLGFTFGGVMAISLVGSVTIGQGADEIGLTIGVELNLTAEGTPDVLLGREVGTVTLADIVRTFTSTDLPGVLDQVALVDFELLVVANPLGWDNPLDGKHYAPGLAFAGTLLLLGVRAAFAVQVDAAHGVFAKGQLDGPLEIGPVRLGNATNPALGPYVELNTAGSPYVSMSVAISVFEVSAVVDALVDDGGFRFAFALSVPAVGETTFALALQGETGFDLRAAVRIMVGDIGPIAAGPFDLGTLHVNTGVDVRFMVAATTSGDFAFGFGGSLTFLGMTWDLPDVQIAIRITSLAEIPGLLLERLRELLFDAGAFLLRQADVLFRYIGEGILSFSEDVAKILNHELGVALDEATRLLKDVSARIGRTAEDIARLVTGGYDAVAEAVAGAMRAAGYAAAEIGDAIAGVFAMGAEAVANVLRSVGCSLEEVAIVLRDVFGYAADQVAGFFKDAWGVAGDAVNAALDAAGYAADAIAGAMEDAFDWTWNAVEDAASYFDPTNW